MAMTLDGKVARPDGRWHGISSARDRERMDEIRLEHDAVVAGKNSLLADNPRLLPHPTEDGTERSARPVLLARRELYPLGLRVLNQTRIRPLCLAHRELRERPLFAGEPPPDPGAALEEFQTKCDVVWLPGDDFEPERIFARLAEHGLHRVLLETGPAFNYQVFARDLLDVLYLTLVPFVFGQNDLPGILHGPDALPGFDERRWRLDESERIEAELFLRYRRERN